MRLTMVVPDLPIVLNDVLEAGVRVNTKMLIAALIGNKPVPPLYGLGTRYKQEPLGREWWQLVMDNITEPTLDCEDGSMHRAAELRVGGVLAVVPPHLWRWSNAPTLVALAGRIYPARAIAVRTGPKTYHGIVEHPNGHREDPSRALGMAPRPKRRP